MLIFYDCEVFAKDWIVVFLSSDGEKVFHNDPDGLKRFYSTHKGDVWTGYNSRNYDQYIIQAILSGTDPKKVNDWIISGKSGYTYSDKLQRYPIVGYDVFFGMNSLKTLEGFMGHDIRETDVDFDIQRSLTPEELEAEIKYCRNDVHETAEVFERRLPTFEAHLTMVRDFGLPFEAMGRSDAQLIAMVLGAKRRNFSDEFDLIFPDTLKLQRYQYVKEWYETHSDYSQRLDTEVMGILHTFGWGGLHGQLEKVHAKGRLVMADVTSLYPSLIIRYGFMSRTVRDPGRYKEIYEMNLRLKKEKNPKRGAYKLICNTTYGCMRDIHNPLYDPLMGNNICVAGQLLLLDLLEHLEDTHSCTLLQTNTDGVLLNVKDMDTVRGVIEEWESRTGLSMELSEYSELFQKDVNSYILLDKEGGFKAKGGYVKELSELDNDLPIVNRAVREYLISKVPPSETVGASDEMIDFQRIVKVSSKYKAGWHNGKKLKGRTYRIYASKYYTDGPVYKTKSDRWHLEKFANTPDHARVVNEDVTEMKVPDWVDRKWYVQTAVNRLRDFGVKI